MAAMMARQENDEDRLDAFERAFVALRSELTDEMNRRFDRMEERNNVRFMSVEARFDAMHRTMIRFSFALIVTLIATCGGLVAAQL